MATANTTSSKQSSEPAAQAWPDLLYSSDVPMPIGIRPGATIDDVENLLSAKLVQLEAMLLATHGEAGESFRCRSDVQQDNFMWSCMDVATECRALFSALNDSHVNQEGGAA
ncbi:MAG: hypothetical protein Q7J42_06885 [Sulfuritalea sp.]|nr:hypothetical protein [Sulfuritalea sp.]